MAFDASILKGDAAGDPTEWTRERERSSASSASGGHKGHSRPTSAEAVGGYSPIESGIRAGSSHLRPSSAAGPSSGYAEGESEEDRKRRTKSKRLETIFNEHDREYRIPSSDAELEARRREAVALRSTDVKEVGEMLIRARNADLCFVIDATSSMGRYINQVKNVIVSIVDALTKPHGSHMQTSSVLSSIRLACVAYRDHSDGDKRFQVLDFTENVSQFCAFLSSVAATGGGDPPEDVLGALDKTRSLSWSRNSGVKQIFHIADAPAHGNKFHDPKIPDDYPDGHPSDPDHIELFKWIANTMKIFYHFGKINDYTNRMIEVFSTAAGKHLDSFDVNNPGRIEAAVVDSVTASVDTVVACSKTSCSKTIVADATIVKEYELRKYTIDKSLPDWSELPLQEGRLQSYKMPERVEDIIDDKPLAKRNPKKTFVRIAPNPFAEGSERIAYYGLDVTKHGMESETVLVVFKEFKRLGKGMNSANKYELVNQMQTIASFMAFEFTNALKSARVTHPVEMKFLKVKTFSTQTLKDKWRFMTCERQFHEGGKFIRFSNNAGYSLLEERARKFGIDPQYVAMVLAFSHWTHAVTGGQLMIVDLEGIVTRDKHGQPAIVLTDPAIHCVDLDRFGKLNHGTDGMRSFFETHECNRVCEALHLPKGAIGVSSAATAARASPPIRDTLSRLSIH